MSPIPSIPTFVVAGQPNEGKTTVLATLAEDDRAEIGPVPGTTTRCTPYPIELDDIQIMVFIDTPGFQEPAAALEWFRAQPADQQSAASFLEQHAGQDRFSAEREILQPLAQGAAVIYVVDASRPVRESDRQEIEILRLCGNPRIAVIYRKERAQDFRPEWNRVLARDFNLRREFDAHQASFRERIELLEAAKTVIQEWQPVMERAILALRDDWDLRLRRTAAELCRFLRDAITMRQLEPIDPEQDPNKAADRAKSKLQNAVRDREVRFRLRIRQLFRHRRENWELPELILTDLFSDHVWRCLGLSKPQLVAAGTAVGAAAGGTFDVAVGGHSFLLGALVGAASGAVLSWLSANRAVQVQLPHLRWGPFRFGGHALGGIHAEASVDPRSNLIWILIDRAWFYIEAASSWSHGRRQDPVSIVSTPNAKLGITARFTGAERALVTRFIRLLRKSGASPSSLDAAERDLRDLWLRLLRELTGAKP